MDKRKPKLDTMESSNVSPKISFFLLTDKPIFGEKENIILSATSAFVSR